MRCRGVGPVPCEFMLVAECPGWEEDRAGIPLVGKTGKEVNRYLNGYDLPLRDDIFLTNLYREYRGKDYEYTPADLAADEPELLEELARVQPRIIITLGRHSTRYFLGDVDLDDVHAIPWQHGEYVVFPIFHVAAGFHNPDIQAYVSYGFQQLAVYLDGGLAPRRLFDDPLEGKEQYEEVSEVPPLEGRVAVDTEGTRARPWSVQLSAEPGRGTLVAGGAGGREGRLHAALCRNRLLFHHALHDMLVLEGYGALEGVLSPPDWLDGRFDDTMTMAYLLQVEPRGLKALATRHCGMRMQSYESVLGDAETRLAVDWLSANLDLCNMEYRQRQEAEYSARVDAGKRLRVLPKLPKSKLHRAIERCLRSTRPRGLWLDQDPAIQNEALALGREMPEATLDHVPRAAAIRYACRDADATLRLADQLEPRLDAMGLRDVYNLELGTYPLLVRMMQNGMKPDLEHFRSLSVLLGDEIAHLQEELASLTGRAINANSGDQVAAYLFDELGLMGTKKTESGRFSTNDKVLEALEHEHGSQYPALTTIRAYRELYKLKHTFVDRIPVYVQRYPYDGRVHCELKSNTVTGRLAAANPNMLAQPEHGAFAKLFKQGWVAEDGHVVCHWDMAQIELRILAHLSQDARMLAVFRGEVRNPDGSRVDLHAATAERIFGIPPAAQDKSKHRLPAKAVNFGLPMGMTAVGLALELRKNGLAVDEDDAQRWIDETMELYSGVPIYQERMKAEARRLGYIRCLSGRIRYIGGIQSYIPAIRSEAERFAFATPIQEGAQTVMKTVEASVWTDIIVPRLRQGQYVEPLLQVHDALKLEVAEGLQADVHREMYTAMTTAYQGLSVPLDVEGEWGYTFGEMERLA